MMGNKANIKIVFLIFLFLIFLYGINNFLLIKKQYTFPLYPDEAWHLSTTLRYYEILKEFSLNIFYRLLEVDSLYPPLYFISGASLALVTGFSRLNVVMINIFFFLIMLISTYLIGKKISNNKYTGLFAAFILSMFPMIFGMSRWFMLDFALTAMVALSICCLIHTDEFTNRKMSLLFGVSLGLVLLTKWTAPIFIIGPFLYVLFKPSSVSKLQFQKRFQNIAYILIICFILAGIWS